MSLIRSRGHSLFTKTQMHTNQPRLIGHRHFILQQMDELGLNEYEGDALGITGKFVKEAPIFCGGKNGGYTLKTCFEYDGTKNE